MSNGWKELRGPVYGVKVRSCDDGCQETVAVFADPILAGIAAERVGGVVAQMELQLPAGPDVMAERGYVSRFAPLPPLPPMPTASTISAVNSCKP